MLPRRRLSRSPPCSHSPGVHPALLPRMCDVGRAHHDRRKPLGAASDVRPGARRCIPRRDPRRDLGYGARCCERGDRRSVDRRDHRRRGSRRLRRRLGLLPRGAPRRSGEVGMDAPTPHLLRFRVRPGPARPEHRGDRLHRAVHPVRPARREPDGRSRRGECPAVSAPRRARRARLGLLSGARRHGRGDASAGCAAAGDPGLDRGRAGAGRRLRRGALRARAPHATPLRGPGHPLAPLRECPAWPECPDARAPHLGVRIPSGACRPRRAAR